MNLKYAIAFVAMLASAPVLADRLDTDAARRFIVGKQFAFTCFDGSRGDGRILSDGSVLGTIQVRGSGPVHSVWLPAGSIKVKGEAFCASVNGIPIEPCFDLDQKDDQGFRGSVAGMDHAYCDFTRRLSITGRKTRSQPSEPLSLNPKGR
jgi:hypothetical protein